MPLKEKMEAALNKQVNAELYSAYLYMSMGAYLDDIDLPGMSQWMRIQAMEETYHGMKLHEFIMERGGRAKLEAIDAPPFEWKSVTEVFEEVYAHECKVTGLIHDLVDLAIELRDHASNQMLQWFVDEQVEEEATADGILKQVKMVEKDSAALLMLDKELGARTMKIPLEWQPLVRQV